MIDIVGYFDYRKFLLDVLAEGKTVRPRLSLRALARKLNLDASFFSKVLKGTRNLSADDARSVVKVLGFTKVQAEYFELLVQFNQSRSHESKREYFEKLLKKKSPPSKFDLQKKHYEYYAHWYTTVIRELLHCCPLVHDYHVIGRMLDPPIRSSEVKYAIDLLLKLGLIRRKQGSLVLADRFITASPDVDVMAVRNFQLAMMELAKGALARLPKERREISTLTVSLSCDGFDEVMEAVGACRARIIEIADNDQGVNGVYQVNFQAFPVTKIVKKKKKNEA